MRGRRGRQRAGLLLVVGLLAAGLGLLAHATHVDRRPELSTVDTRFSIRGRQAPPRDVVLVALDDRSLAELNARPPIPRHFHARVIDALRRAGARAIAYDFQFTEPTTPREDDALIKALRRRPGVVLATSKVRDDGSTTVLGGGSGLTLARAVPANTNFPARTARGGVIRRVVESYEGLIGFAFTAAASARTPDRGGSSGGLRGGLLVTDAGLRPFSGDGAWIDFAGPPGTVSTVSFVDVVRGRVPAARFRGKVVVVGATAQIIQDLHAAATGEAMPGSEIEANAIATILRNFPLRDAPGWLSVLLIAGAGLVVPGSALRLRGLRWLPVAVAAVLVYPVAAQLAFDGGRIIPVAAPALAWLLAVLGTLAVANWTDLRERRRLQAVFGRFVPPSVVDEVVAQAGEDVGPLAARREGTVLFCDLRAFTTRAEGLEVEEVIGLLNRYLTAMSDAILDHGGTVVSYQGDGIMAVFGAPLEQPDHADRALAAARDMLGPALERFNASLPVGEPMRIGLGLCTGPVMSGTVGSARRVEYAAVGDTTNTAARLQGMTKEAGVPILLADSTREALTTQPADLEEAGELDVRGRTERLRAWTLASASG